MHGFTYECNTTLLKMFKYFVLCTVLQISFAVEFKIKNYAPYKLWIGSLGNPGKGNPNNGGFALNSKAEVKNCTWTLT